MLVPGRVKEPPHKKKSSFRVFPYKPSILGYQHFNPYDKCSHVFYNGHFRVVSCLFGPAKARQMSKALAPPRRRAAPSMNSDKVICPSPLSCWETGRWKHLCQMGVSESGGYPQIIQFHRVFHYKPSILGYIPIFGNTQMLSL